MRCRKWKRSERKFNETYSFNDVKIDQAYFTSEDVDIVVKSFFLKKLNMIASSLTSSTMSSPVTDFDILMLQVAIKIHGVHSQRPSRSKLHVGNILHHLYYPVKRMQKRFVLCEIFRCDYAFVNDALDIDKAMSTECAMLIMTTFKITIFFAAKD